MKKSLQKGSATLGLTLMLILGGAGLNYADGDARSDFTSHIQKDTSVQYQFND